MADEGPIDRVTVEAWGTPANRHSFQSVEFNFENFTSFSLTNSMTAPAEASFELGDETGWNRIADLVSLGAQYRIFVDDRLRLTGRVEQLNTAMSADQSSTQAFVVRTKLTDAVYSGAPQGLRVKNTSIREFILGLYASIGLGPDAFDFRGDVSRDLMTGRPTRGGRDVATAALDPLKEDEAKVQPPESVFAAADRHLRRHGLLHWDGPDGKIVVAAPDDEQEAIYHLRCLQGDGAQYNNLLTIDRVQDVADAPTVLGMFGTGGKVSATRAKVSSILRNEDLIARGFTRTVSIVDEAMRSKALADRRAKRELAQRNRGLDRLSATVDGLSFRERAELLPWTPDTTVDVIVEQMGGALGTYYLEEVQMTRNAGGGDVTRLTLVRKGVWKL